MKLNKTDYMLERTSDGGYYAWLTVNMQCNAYGDRKSTRLNSSHASKSRMPSSA